MNYWFKWHKELSIVKGIIMAHSLDFLLVLRNLVQPVHIFLKFHGRQKENAIYTKTVLFGRANNNQDSN